MRKKNVNPYLSPGMSPSQDLHIAIQLKNKDPEALQSLIHLYFPILCRFAQRILQDKAAAEDATTDVFVKLWQKAPEFDDSQHIKNFLYRSIRNTCLNVLRSRQREEARHETFTDIYLHDEDAFAREILQAEVLAEIRKELQQFAPRLREIFIMAYFQQLSNEEIAQKLNLSNQTVRNQKASALSLLRKKIRAKFPLLLLSQLLLP